MAKEGRGLGGAPISKNPKEEREFAPEDRRV